MGGKIGLTRENIGASLGFFTNVSPVLGSRIVQSVVEVSKMAWLISTSFTVPLCVNKVHFLSIHITVFDYEFPNFTFNFPLQYTFCVA